LEAWKKILERAACPIWFDVHSLVLGRKLGGPREYVSFPDWKDWVQGVSFLQANREEVACMLGFPGKRIDDKGNIRFAEQALDLGLEAVFITMGEEGVFVMTPSRWDSFPISGRIQHGDTTGCGDVFCAGAVQELARGRDPFAAAVFGMELASKKAAVKGIEATYRTIREHIQDERQSPQF
jgi:sugar/nucleoside kinase (ribokinase family)